MPTTNSSRPGSEPDYSGYKNVAIEFEDGITWVTLNRPEKRNAMSPALNREMLHVLDALELDDRCSVLVLTGAGDSFSSGMDLKEYFRETDNATPTEVMRVRRDSMGWQWRRLMFFPKPTIAMVNGWCFGGAFTPLVSCDIAIAADEATFGLSEINWGIIPGGQVTKSLVFAMSFRNAMYYTLTGESFDGRKASQTGLVFEAVPRAQLRERTRAIAKKLMEKNPHALRACKEAIRACMNIPFESSGDYLAAKSTQLRFVDDENGRNQGLTQFLDEKSYRPGLGAMRRPKK